MKYLLFISIIAIHASSFAQHGSITGKVTQADSVHGIAGVYVYLANNTHLDVTKNDGSFKISNIPVGTHKIFVSCIRHATHEEYITIKENEGTFLHIALPESAIHLENVYIAPRGREGIHEIPGSIQQLRSQELSKFSYTDVNRALRSVPGVNIQEEDGFGLRTNIGLRGTGVERSQKITVMEDGVLSAPAPYTAPAAYYFPTFGRLEGVEIYKGGSQITYGPFTSGGAINLISTQIPRELEGNIRLSAGSFGSRTAHASVGDYFKHTAYMVETFQYSADGFKTFDSEEGIGFDKKDYLGKFQIHSNGDSRIYQSVTLKLGAATETSNESYLGLSHEDFEKTPYLMYAGAQQDVLTTDHSQQSITHRIHPRSNISIVTTAYTTNFSRNWYKLDALRDSAGNKHSISSILSNPHNANDTYGVIKGDINSSGQSALYVKANNRTYATHGIQSTGTIHFSTTNLQHSIQTGFRYHTDNMDRFQWEDSYTMNNGVIQLKTAGTHGTESNRISEARAFAGFTQYTLTYNKFLFKPGVRYENIHLEQKDYGKNDPERTGADMKLNKNHVQVIIPGIGTQYSFSNNLNVFAGVHKGFSPPGAQENSKPEESINYELGVRYMKNSNYIQFVSFYNNYSNLLGSDLAAVGGEGLGEMHNAGAVGTFGVEFDFSYDILTGIEQKNISVPLQVAYTYSNAEFKNSFASSFKEWGNVEKGDKYPYMSNHQLFAGIGVEHKRFSITISGKYTGSMRTSPGKGTPSKDSEIPAHLIFDASAHYIIKPNISLFSTITNISDKTYITALRPAGIRVGMPRATTIGIRARI